MNYAITKDNIKLAKCLIFEEREYNYLVRKTITTNEEYRKVLVFMNHIIDFETADDLSIIDLDNIDDYISEIKTDTYYVEDIYEYTQLQNRDLEYVTTLLKRYQDKKLKESSKKLIKKSKKD